MRIKLIAVGIATLVVSLGGAVAPNAAGSEARSSGDAIKSVFGTIGSLYSAYSDCRANIAVSQPCLAGDGDNIREALRSLAEIQNDISSNQNELMARFDEVDTQLNRARVEGYIRELRSVGLNTRMAVGAWTEYLGCLQAQSTGAESCWEFRGGNELAPIPTPEGLEANKDLFLYYADKLPSDVGATVEAYAGAGGVDRYRLADALWILNKQKLLLEAKATNAAFRTSPYTPFVTPELASSVNDYLAFYSGLFSTYGSVLQARTEMLRDEALERNDTASVRIYETQLRAIKFDIERRINSGREDSVKGVEATYGLTPLNRGEIMMANRPGSEGVTIFMSDGNRPGDRAMRNTDVEILGQGLRNFGSASSLMEAQPEAFPKDRWYEVRADVQPLVCRGAERYLVWYLATYSRVPLNERGEDVGGPVLTEVVRVRVVDAPPSTAKLRDVTCLGEDGDAFFGHLYIESEKIMKANVRWSVDYQWSTIPWNDNMGKGVFAKRFTGPANRLVTEQQGNRMVRWPGGFTPTMPPDY